MVCKAIENKLLRRRVSSPLLSLFALLLSVMGNKPLAGCELLSLDLPSSATARNPLLLINVLPEQPQRTKTPCTARKSQSLILTGVAFFSLFAGGLSVLDTQSHQSPCRCPERSSSQVSLACFTLSRMLSHSLSMKMAYSIEQSTQGLHP